jgi:MFS family permease
VEVILKSVIAERDALVAERAERPRSARWTLASLSLAMLLSALGTSIANVALPSLAQAFSASIQQVQWIVLAYLLASTTLIVSVGRLGDLEEGESQGLPVWSRHVGDPILGSNITRRVDFALFMVAAIENDELIHEAPAIVGCQTPSALAHGAIQDRTTVDSRKRTAVRL